MPTLWVYVIVFISDGGVGPPFIESQWPTQLACERHGVPDYGDQQWLGSCWPIKRDDWPYVRIHR